MAGMRCWSRRHVLVAAGMLCVAPSLVQGQEPAHLTPAAIKQQIKTPLVAPSAGEIAAFVARRRPTGAALGPSVGRNRQVSKNQSEGDALRTGASETTIAVTHDGQRMVAGWNDGEGFAFAPTVRPSPGVGPLWIRLLLGQGENMAGCRGPSRRVADRSGAGLKGAEPDKQVRHPW